MVRAVIVFLFLGTEPLNLHIFFSLWQQLTANQLQFWGGKAFPHGNQPVHYAASLYAESEDLINEVITYCKNRKEGTRPGELNQYGFYKVQHWEKKKRDFQRQWRNHLELFKTRPKKRKRKQQEIYICYTCIERPCCAGFLKKKEEEKVSHSCNIQIFPLNESLVSWLTV